MIMMRFIVVLLHFFVCLVFMMPRFRLNNNSYLLVNLALYLLLFLIDVKAVHYVPGYNISKIKNKIISRKSDTCNPPQGDPACGSMEFLGCVGNKKYYHESTVMVNWFEAWGYCRTFGMHLATIESRFEQTFLETFILRPGSTAVTYWTSGTRFSGNFVWMTTGNKFTFTNWRPGEPNNRGSELCIEIVTNPFQDSFLWNDRQCANNGYTLCQKNIPEETATTASTTPNPDDSKESPYAY